MSYNCPTRQMCAPMSTPKIYVIPYLMLTSYSLKSYKNIREPPDCIGNEPTPDIPQGGSGQDQIIDKYMPFVINMLLMKACLSTKYRNGG